MSSISGARSPFGGPMPDGHVSSTGAAERAMDLLAELGRSQHSAAGAAAFRGDVGQGRHAVIRAAVEPDVVAAGGPVYRPGGVGTATAAVWIVGRAYRVDDGRAALIGRLVSAEAKALGKLFAVPTAGRHGEQGQPAAPIGASRPTGGGASMAVPR